MKIEFVCDKNNWKINRNLIGYIASIYHEKSVFFLLNDKTIFVAVNSEIGECKKMKHTYSFKEFVDKGTFESDPQNILEESIEQWEKDNSIFESVDFPKF